VLQRGIFARLSQPLLKCRINRFVDLGIDGTYEEEVVSVDMILRVLAQAGDGNSVIEIDSQDRLDQIACLPTRPAVVRAVVRMQISREFVGFAVLHR